MLPTKDVGAQVRKEGKGVSATDDSSHTHTEINHLYKHNVMMRAWSLAIKKKERKKERNYKNGRKEENWTAFSGILVD
jgi:outer membrane protease